MIILLKGQSAPREGKFLTETEYRKLNQSIYIPELDVTLPKDKVLEHLRRSFGLEKAEEKLEKLSKVVVG